MVPDPSLSPKLLNDPSEAVLSTSLGSRHTLHTLVESDDGSSNDSSLAAPDPVHAPADLARTGSHETTGSVRPSRSESNASSRSYTSNAHLPLSPPVAVSRSSSQPSHQYPSRTRADSNSSTCHQYPSRTRADSNSSTSSFGSTTSPTLYRSSGSWFSTLSKSRVLLIATGQAVLLFLACFLALVIAVRTLLPPIDPQDSPHVKIPRSFEDLKHLNSVLQLYKTQHFSRVLSTFVVIYLFLQTFSVPGSMYMSILAGAMYGVFKALVLVCFCVATGASLCYGISAIIGPKIITTSPTWLDRVDSWTERVRRQGNNVFSYLIVLRVAPLPPHWVINLVAPHVGVGFRTFYSSTFVGVMGVSFIHTQIGTALDQMASPEDFHLISWRNFFGLAGVIVAALVPVFLRMRWKNELEEAATDGQGVRLPTDNSLIPRSRSSTLSNITNVIPTATRVTRNRSGSKTLEFLDEEDANEDAASLISLAHSSKDEVGPGVKINGYTPDRHRQPSSSTS